MYRSRPVVLVIFAAAAACSTRDDSASIAGLAQDTTLARLSLNHQAAQTLPAACGTVAAAATAVAVNEPQAKDLAREAYDAELLGNVQEAQSLLSRASELDGTDESVAYHLGRTSEAVGDRSGAVTAYCHYLSLTSTAAGAADVRQRLARLSQPPASVAANTGGAMPSARPRASARTHVASRRSSSVSPHAVATTTRLPQHDAQSARAADGRAIDSPDGNGGVYRGASDGDVIATSSGAPVSRQPTSAPSTRRSGPTRAQGAGVGAVAGAIIGAAAGRSVKSAVIGAAAGGILGTVVAGASK